MTLLTELNSALDVSERHPQDYSELSCALRGCEGSEAAVMLGCLGAAQG